MLSNEVRFPWTNFIFVQGGHWLKYVQNHRWFFIISLAVLLIVSLVLLTIIIINKQEYKSSVIVHNINDDVVEPDMIAPVDLPTGDVYSQYLEIILFMFHWNYLSCNQKHLRIIDTGQIICIVKFVTQKVIIFNICISVMWTFIF